MVRTGSTSATMSTVLRAAAGVAGAVEAGGGFVAGRRHDVGERQIRGTVGGAEGLAGGGELGEREGAPGVVALNGGFGLRATGMGDGGHPAVGRRSGGARRRGAGRGGRIRP